MLVVCHAVVRVGLEHHLGHVRDGGCLVLPLHVVLVQGHALHQVEHRLILAGALIHKDLVYNEFLDPHDVVNFVRQVADHVEEVSDLFVLRHVRGDWSVPAIVTDLHVVRLQELAGILLLLVVKLLALSLVIVRIFGVFNRTLFTLLLDLSHRQAALWLIHGRQVHRKKGRYHELVPIGFFDKFVIEMCKLTDFEL